MSRASGVSLLAVDIVGELRVLLPSPQRSRYKCSSARGWTCLPSRLEGRRACRGRHWGWDLPRSSCCPAEKRSPGRPRRRRRSRCHPAPIQGEGPRAGGEASSCEPQGSVTRFRQQLLIGVGCLRGSRVGSAGLRGALGSADLTEWDHDLWAGQPALTPRRGWGARAPIGCLPWSVRSASLRPRYLHSLALSATAVPSGTITSMPRLSMPVDMPHEVLVAIETIGNNVRTEILRQTSRGALTALELADRIGVRSASIHRHLIVLERHGLVFHAETHRW